ncbi:MAG: tetratricopeptide repeat protein [Lentisphaeraceae bacterium]|nr:tetratricopeptide repeat protein [Lentisphaeraceae bacterium]
MNKEQATLLLAEGNYQEAVEAFNALIVCDSEDAELHCFLGMACQNLQESSKANTHYLRALELNPNLTAALSNLALLRSKSGLGMEAVKLFEKAHSLDPQNSLLAGNFADAFCDIAEHQKAAQYYRLALELDPTNLRAHSNFLLATNYSHTISSEECGHLSTAFSRNCGETKCSMPSYQHKKLRIANVSGDFKRHSVAYFIEGILHFHDRSKFDIYCYSDVRREDEITRRLRNFDLTWRPIFGLDDAQVKEQILNDEIDILIDLAAHTGMRMKLFSLRCAPQQITYLGYPNTSGLQNMDYRIVDTVSDLCTDDKRYSEKLLRLSRCFLAFCPPLDSPDVAPSPCLKNGYITFGSFNNLNKFNRDVIRLWSRTLKEVKNSRLLIKSKQFNDPLVVERVAGLFVKRGIARERVEFLSYANSLDDHLLLYNRVDIALDTIPYNGTTTSCEALHMGVPVITLEGVNHVGRVTTDILKSIGLHSTRLESGFYLP